MIKTDETTNITPKTREPHFTLKLLKLRFVVPVLLVLILLLSPFIYRSYYLSLVPETGHPFELKTDGTLGITPIENAHAGYEAAVAKYVDYKPVGTEVARALHGNWDSANGAVRKWLADNQEAMKLWRAATDKPDYAAVQPKDYEVTTLLPLLDPMEQFAQLAYFQGQKLEAEGKQDEALIWYRAVFRCSRHFGRHGSVIEQLIGMKLHDKSVSYILRWANNKKLTAEQIQRTIDNATVDFAVTAPSSRALKCEYFMMHNLFTRASSLGMTGGSGQPVKELLHQLTRVEPTLSQNTIRHYLKNQLQHVDKPRHLRKSKKSGILIMHENPSAGSANSDTVTPEQILAAFEGSVYAQLLLPAVDKFLLAADRTQTRQNIFLVSLAAQKYKRDHGEFPPDSATLIKKKYLKEMPLDSLQNKKALIQYKNSVSCVCVYSSGEDQIDDGGCAASLDDAAIGDFGYVLHPLIVKIFVPLEHVESK